MHKAVTAGREEPLTAFYKDTVGKEVVTFMDKIASFCVDHTKLKPGIYVSRIDGDIATYDIRVKTPNQPPFLETAAMHTIEHLFATFARNSEFADRVIYFGPMGCRTGFYFLVRDLSGEQALALIKDIVGRIAGYRGEIPGNSAVECGNYLEHDLEEARREMALFSRIIES